MDLILKIIFLFGTLIYLPQIIKAIIHEGISASEAQVFIFIVSITGLITMFFLI